MPVLCGWPFKWYIWIVWVVEGDKLILAKLFGIEIWVFCFFLFFLVWYIWVLIQVGIGGKQTEAIALALGLKSVAGQVEEKGKKYEIQLIFLGVFHWDLILLRLNGDGRITILDVFGLCKSREERKGKSFILCWGSMEIEMGLNIRIRPSRLQT